MSHYQQLPWCDFTANGTVYALSHLDEYSFDIVDSGQAERKILVTFEDHCFTRKIEDGDDLALLFPGCSRKPAGTGIFCLKRWHHSLFIRTHIAEAIKGDVWIADGEGFAIVPTIDHNGKRHLYCILFDLKKLSGLPFDLRMIVKTAYPLDDEPRRKTHGNTRFRHLVSLRLQGKLPPKNREQRRRRPQIK